jgi:mycofactocin precursor
LRRDPPTHHEEDDMTVAETAREPAPDRVEATAGLRDETPPVDPPPAEAGALVEADLLVEDVSIDGMCGVY